MPQHHPPARTSELIERAQTELSPTLVSPEAWQRLSHAARLLPELSSGVFLECHLSEPSLRTFGTCRTDLIVRFTQQQRASLAQLPWNTCTQSFLRRWGDPADILHAIPFIDFEFDLAPQHPAENLSAAWLCPTLLPILSADARALEAAHQRELEQGNARFALQLAEQILEQQAPLTDRARLADIQTQLRECFAALPAFGSIHYVNDLWTRPSRAQRAVRLITSLPRGELRRYLLKLSFRGNAALLAEQFERFCPGSIWADFDADLEPEGLAERIGIYSEFAEPRRTDRVLAKISSALCAAGACNEAQIQALYAWVAEPRRLLLFKTVVNGAAVQAKAYLELG